MPSLLYVLPSNAPIPHDIGRLGKVSSDDRFREVQRYGGTVTSARSGPFPHPVLTVIGHSRDSQILANKRAVSGQISRVKTSRNPTYYHFF